MPLQPIPEFDPDKAKLRMLKEEYDTLAEELGKETDHHLVETLHGDYKLQLKTCVDANNRASYDRHRLAAEAVAAKIHSTEARMAAIGKEFAELAGVDFPTADSSV